MRVRRIRRDSHGRRREQEQRCRFEIPIFLPQTRFNFPDEAEPAAGLRRLPAKRRVRNTARYRGLRGRVPYNALYRGAGSRADRNSIFEKTAWWSCPENTRGLWWETEKGARLCPGSPKTDAACFDGPRMKNRLRFSPSERNPLHAENRQNLAALLKRSGPGICANTITTSINMN